MFPFLAALVVTATPNVIPCVNNGNSFQCVTYVSNYDGDTLTVNIPSVPALFGSHISIRVRGIDTPEIKSNDKCEKAAAIKAKELAASYLKKAIRIDLNNIGRDKYFRVLADVIVDGKLNLSQLLLDAKLAYVYDGGTKVKQNWCDKG